MEELRAVALEEIALEGRTGCSLPRLWQLLEDRMPLDGVQQLLPVLRQHLWQQLRAEPTLILSTEDLQAEAKAAAAAAPAKKPSKRKKKAEDEEEAGAGTLLGGRPTASLPHDEVPAGVSEAEAAHIVLVAPEHAWLSVVGVFDELYATQQLSGPQLNTLEIVGQSRHAGAVSAEMANTLGIQHRNFFYVLKMLEARGLIVRSKLMLPDGKGNSGWTTTQLIHLPRFAPRLAIGSEAIIREVKVSDGGAKKAGPSQEPAPSAAAAAAAAAGGSSGAGSSKRSSGAGGGNKLVVRDDAVTLKEICDFLAQQGAGKYVSESQVKTVLGFTGSTAAHRQWRRLRLRLVKLGCISLDTGLLGNKALSVLKLLKPYKLKVPVVVDSDEDELQAELDEAADAEEDGGAGDKAAADADAPAAAAAAAAAADGEAGGEGVAAATAAAAGGGDGAGSSKASRLQGVPVEVGQNQMLLELICEAGDDGVLTPSLTKRMGISPKLFLKGLPDMCKKYGVKAEYDMTKKTLTNRITAPQHLLEAYAVQQAALRGASGTLTPAPSAPLAAAAAAAGSAGVPPSAGLPPRPPAAKTPAAAAGAGAEGGSQQQQQQQQQQQVMLSRQGSATQSVMSDAAAGAAAAGDTDAATAATAAAGTAAAAAEPDAMDIDTLVDAAAEKVVREQQQQQSPEQDQNQSEQQQQPEVPADAAAAAAAASAAAAAGVAGAGVTRGINLGGGTWGTAVVSGTAASGGPGRRTVMGVSRHQLRRLEALRQKLREQGFFLQQEVRSVIAAAEAKQADKPPPQVGRGPEGPDTRTCNRLVQHLLDAGEVQLARLQYNQELVATTREVDVFVPKGTELTEELLQRIAAYNSTLLRSIRQRSVKRREVMLQSAKVLGVADSEGADKASLELNAPRAMAIATGKETADAAAAAAAAAADGEDGQLAEPPAAAEAAAAATAEAVAAVIPPSPEKHQLQLLMPGPSIRRRLRGFRSLAVLHKGSTGAAAGRGAASGPEPPAAAAAAAAAAAPAAAPAAAAGGRAKSARKRSAAIDVSAHFPASARRPPVTTLGGSLMASLGVKDTKASGQEQYKGAAIMRMHHNGYIPSTMLRAKLLHQYLAGLAGLRVEHHEDIHPSAPAAAAGAAGAAGSSAAGTPTPAARRRQLRFIFDKADEQSGSDRGEGEEEVEVLPRPNVVQRKRDAAEASLPAIPAAAAAADAAAAAAGDAAAQPGSGGSGGGGQQGQQAGPEQWTKLEQQLGGRLLSVQDLWLNMPLALALQVAGVTRNISNLLQLVCNTDPPPRIGDFDKEQIAAVFEARSWNRVVAAMSVLARLKLLTPARRRRTDGLGSSQPEQQPQQQSGGQDQQEGAVGEGQREEDDPSQGWVQSQARSATHLVIGASGVLDMPPFASAEDAAGPQDDDAGTDGGEAAATASAPTPAAAAPAAPAGAAADAGGISEGGKRVTYDFRRAGHWRQYWATMQRVFDSPLMTPELVANTFPPKAVPDVARHRSWVWYRGLPMRPWLRLLERIHDLPIEQLDQHMARTLADELGVPYQPVLVVITRWRTEANEERERQGLAKVYLLEHKAAEQEALRAAKAAAEGGEGRTASELRKMRVTQ